MGSKNAAFYIGRSVKMSTKQKDSPVVHELKLEAEALEQRYQEGQVRINPLSEFLKCVSHLRSLACLHALALLTQWACFGRFTHQ